MIVDIALGIVLGVFFLWLAVLLLCAFLRITAAIREWWWSDTAKEIVCIGASALLLAAGLAWGGFDSSMKIPGARLIAESPGPAQNSAGPRLYRPFPGGA